MKRWDESALQWATVAAGGWIVVIVLLLSMFSIANSNEAKLAASQQEITRLSKEIERLKSAPCECSFVATWDGKMCRVQRVAAK